MPHSEGKKKGKRKKEVKTPEQKSESKEEITFECTLTEQEKNEQKIIIEYAERQLKILEGAYKKSRLIPRISLNGIQPNIENAEERFEIQVKHSSSPNNNKLQQNPIKEKEINIEMVLACVEAIKLDPRMDHKHRDITLNLILNACNNEKNKLNAIAIAPPANLLINNQFIGSKYSRYYIENEDR